MIEIPNSTPQISLNVPGVNAPYERNFGKTGAAIESIGNTVASTGIDLYSQINKAQAIDESSRAVIKKSLADDQDIRDLKVLSPDGFIHPDNDPNQDPIKNPDGRPRTIADEFYDRSQKRYMDDQDSMTSELSAQLYRNQALQEASHKIVDMRNASLGLSVASFSEKRAIQNQQVGDDIESHPFKRGIDGSMDLSDSYLKIQSIVKANQAQVGSVNPLTGKVDGLYNQSTSDKMSLKDKEDASMRVMQGIVNDINEQRKEGSPAHLPDLHNALDILKGEDAQSVARKKAGWETISDLMNPAQKAKEEARLISMIPKARELDDKAMNLKLSGYIAAGEMGLHKGQNENPARDDLLNDFNQRLNAETMDTLEYAHNIAKMAKGDTLGEYQSGAFQVAPVQSQYNLVREGGKNIISQYVQSAQMQGSKYVGDLGRDIEKEFYGQMQSKIDSTQSAKEKDFPGFTQGTFQGGDNKPHNNTGYGQKMQALDTVSAVALGKPENAQVMQHALHGMDVDYKLNFGNDMRYYRTMSQSTSAQRGKELSTLPPALSAQGFQGILAAYGDRAQSTVELMIKDGNLDPRYSTVLAAPTKDAMISQIQSIQGSAQWDKLYTGETSKESWDRIHKLFSPIGAQMLDLARGDPTQAKLVQGYESNIHDQYRIMMAANPGGNKDQVAQNAFDKVMDHTPKLESVGEHYSLFGMNLGERGKQFKMLLPSDMPQNQKDTIKANALRVFTPEGLDQIGATAPKGTKFGKEWKDIVISTGTVKRGEYQGKPAYWISSEGINSSGKADGNPQPVLDKNAQRVWISEETMSIPHPGAAPMKPLPIYVSPVTAKGG